MKQSRAYRAGLLARKDGRYVFDTMEAAFAGFQLGLEENSEQQAHYVPAVVCDTVVTSERLVAQAAKVLSDRAADACGVDRDDQWNIYSEDFKADARAVLEAVGVVTCQAEKNPQQP